MRLCSITIYCNVICGWARLGGLWMEYVELLGPDLLATLWVPQAGRAWFASPVAEPFIACGYDAVCPTHCDADSHHSPARLCSVPSVAAPKSGSTFN